MFANCLSCKGRLSANFAVSSGIFVLKLEVIEIVPEFIMQLIEREVGIKLKIAFTVTVMIRFSARGAYLLLVTSRERAYSEQGAYFFFEKQPNV